MPRYTALDAARLISDDGENFLCENCQGELVAESDKLAAQEVGDADDNVRRRRREKLKEMLQKLEVCEFVMQLLRCYSSFHCHAIPCSYIIVFLSDLFEYSFRQLPRNN